VSTDVWAVTSGSYDSYQVHCVYSKRKDARDAVKLMGSRYSVERLPLRTTQPTQITIHFRRADIFDEGIAGETRSYTVQEWDVDLTYPEDNVPARVAWRRVGGARGGVLQVCGTDEALVQSRFYDYRDALLADHVLRTKRGFTK
jgi:hypothetical protein